MLLSGCINPSVKKYHAVLYDNVNKYINSEFMNNNLIYDSYGDVELRYIKVGSIENSTAVFNEISSDIDFGFQDVLVFGMLLFIHYLAI